MFACHHIAVILHLTQDNGPALQQAQQLASANGASLSLLLCTRYGLTGSQQTQIREKMQTQLGNVNDARIEFLTGQPLVSIIQYANEYKVDFIVTQPDESTALSKFFHGSLALSLFRKAVCPVWMVRPPKTDTYQRIMIAINPNTNDEEEQAFNSKLIDIGSALARRLKAECYLVGAWELQEESSLRSPLINVPEDEIQVLIEQRRIQCEHGFKEIQERNAEHLSDVDCHLIHAHPSTAIVNFGLEHNIDIAILGTVARTGIKGFVIGNTAESIINQVDCSIVAVKPVGFVSPIL